MIKADNRKISGSAPRVKAPVGGTLMDEWKAGRRGRKAVGLRDLFLGVAGIAIAGSLLAGFLIDAPAAAPADTTEAPPSHHVLAWVDVTRPFQMFDLTGGDFAKLPLHFAARRDDGGTARQQTLTYGSASPGQHFFRIVLTRYGTEPRPQTTLFIEAARGGADVGLSVLSTGLSKTIDTRFGAIETAAVTLAGGGAQAGCLAFRRLDDDGAPLGMAGFACMPHTSGNALGVLACAIDRLDLISAGDDDALQRFFATAERARQRSCDPARVATVATTDPFRSALATPLKKSFAADTD